MQTFMPLPSFADSARCLDYRRLGKQRVECKQLLQALEVPVGGALPEKPSSWRNHPAAKIWQGFEHSLATYAAVVCREWRSRGYRDSLLPQFEDSLGSLAVTDLPQWFGLQEFHAAHRSNLLRKLPEHYSQFGWAESRDLPYIWPTTV
jgi:hypothetical protein